MRFNLSLSSVYLQIITKSSISQSPFKIVHGKNPITPPTPNRFSSDVEE